MAKKILKRLADSGVKSIDGNAGIANDNFTQAFQQLSWPMRLPYLLSSPPTVSAGPASAASVISSSVLHRCFDLSKFRYIGGPVSRPVNNPDYWSLDLGKYPQITTRAPVAVEFILDTADSTGRFEISSKGWGTGYRVLIKQPDGRWGRTANVVVTHASDGLTYNDLVTLGSAGVYEIRIEFDPPTIFFGIYTAPTDSITATKKPSKRYIVVGDSYTEPTISDTGYSKHEGFASVIAHLTGYDVWSCGSGGTGYVNPAAKVKLADRLANDVFAMPDVDGLIVAMGYNDIAQSITTFDTEVDTCFNMISTSGVTEVYIVPPFYPKGIEAWPVTFLQYYDVVKAAAATYGFVFLDVLNPGGVNEYYLDADFTTTLASAYSSGTTVSVSDVPAYFKTAGSGKNGWWVKLGNNTNQCVREVTGCSGVGPYTLTLSLAPPAALSSGASVTLSGPSYQSGSGRVGATTGDGNSDRYTGSDNAHPTRSGHEHIGQVITALLYRAITG